MGVVCEGGGIYTLRGMKLRLYPIVLCSRASLEAHEVGLGEGC